MIYIPLVIIANVTLWLNFLEGLKLMIERVRLWPPCLELDSILLRHSAMLAIHFLFPGNVSPFTSISLQCGRSRADVQLVHTP